MSCKLLNLPKMCSFNHFCTVLFSIILKFEMLNRILRINSALDGMTKLCKSAMLAISYIIRYKLHTLFMLTLMKIMKQKGMISVINIEFWAPSAIDLMLSASALLKNSLGISDDSVANSIFFLSFNATKNLLLINYIYNLSGGFAELTNRTFEKFKWSFSSLLVKFNIYQSIISGRMSSFNVDV